MSALAHEDDTAVVHWHFGTTVYQMPIEAEPCASCGVPGVVVALPPPLLAQQVDGTTHVCLESIGGCNQGFRR